MEDNLFFNMLQIHNLHLITMLFQLEKKRKDEEDVKSEKTESGLLQCSQFGCMSLPLSHSLFLSVFVCICVNVCVHVYVPLKGRKNTSVYVCLYKLL